MSRLPNAAAASVDDAKVRDYLLNPSNPQNGGKAALFGQFGFARTDWQALTAALGAHAADNEVVRAETSAHGKKFVVECHLQTPDGRNPCLRSVWIIDAGAERPRLVTAY